MKLFQYLLLTSVITSVAINAGGDEEAQYQRNPDATAQYQRNQVYKRAQHSKNIQKKEAKGPESAQANTNDAAVVTKAVITKHAESYTKGTSGIYLQGNIRK
jgi:hypothetical protein